MKIWCILNGEHAKIEDLQTAPIFAINDFVSENIRLYDTKPLCLGSHMENIQQRLLEKNQSIPEKFTEDRVDRYIHSLLNINKVYKNGVCKLLVFWQTFPEQTKPQFCIFTEPLDSFDYNFSTSGFTLEFTDLDIELTHYNLTNCNPQSTETEPIYFDKKGKAFSTQNHDIILIKDEKLIVGKQSQPFTKILASYLLRQNWNIEFVPYFEKNDFLQSDEILLCDQFIGIQWIRRLFNKNTPDDYKSFATKQAKKISLEITNAIKEM